MSSSTAPSLRISTPGQNPPIEVSKWLRIQLLVDQEEMKRLVESLPSFHMFAVSGVMKCDQTLIAPEDFLREYSDYVSILQRGELPDENTYSRVFPTVWTSTMDALYAILVGEDQQLVRIAKPVIQLQHHRFDYSPFDGKFRSMVLGKETTMWGIQFSYPQLYKDPATHEIIMLNDGKAYPNTALFRKLQKWVRDNTIVTPFIVNGEQINVPIRLGKQCLSWINTHPQLAGKNLSVKN